jgi:hypothetical protein
MKNVFLFCPVQEALFGMFGKSGIMMHRRAVAAAMVLSAAVLLLVAAGAPSGPTGGRARELLSGAQRQSAQRLLQKQLRAESLSQRADSDDKIKVYDAAAARKEADDSSPLTRIFGFGPFGEVRRLGTAQLRRCGALACGF